MKITDKSFVVNMSWQKKIKNETILDAGIFVEQIIGYPKKYTKDEVSTFKNAYIAYEKSINELIKNED